MIARGAIHWVDLGPIDGHRPAKRRPVLVVQAQRYNDSRLGTAVVASITSNTANASLASSIFLPSSSTGLARDSVANLAALSTVGKGELGAAVARLDAAAMDDVDRALRRVLGL